MRVSITGGLGFIGAALGSTLSAAGHDVLLTDIRDDDAAAPGTNYIQGSVLDLEDCHVTCEDMDVVVHCAAIHQASIVAKNPLSSIEINVAGTLNLLNAAIAAGAKRFIYVSSGKVFGEPEKLPSVETELPKPREAYALSKLTGEYYCQLLQAQSTMDIVIVRPFSVYGPEQDLNTGYVGMILQSLRDGSELRLPGRPDYVRDFVHIDDVVRLCSLVTTAPLPGLTVLNSGSGQPTSLHKLVSLAAEISGVDIVDHYREPGSGTLERMQACMKQAEAMLNYRPMYDLREGLTDTIDWFMQSRSAAEKAVG